VSGASLRSVVRDLNEAGHGTAWDREWTSQAVRDMLRRPRNAGLTSYRDETFPAAWPAIVPETTWRAVVSILSNPERRTTSSNRVKWLGSGLYVCGTCGKPALRVSHSGGGKRQPAYRCKARDTTRQNGQNSALLGARVVEGGQRPEEADLDLRGEVPARLSRGRHSPDRAVAASMGGCSRRDWARVRHIRLGIRRANNHDHI
jgi:hypothetical protein